MEKENVTLSSAEWKVMERLWEHAPHTGRELTEELGERYGWSRSTTLTVLSRLEAKGAVGTENGGRVKAFIPLISRDEAAIRETKNLLSRAFRGSVSLMVSTLTKKQALSREEKEELLNILKQAEEDDDA